MRHSASVLCILPLILLSQPGPAQTASTPSKELETLVISAFSASHEGWSVDEVLLDDDRRSRFLNACRKLAGEFPAGDVPEFLAQGEESEKGSPKNREVNDRLSAALLHVRKRGGQLEKATRRAQIAPERLADLIPAAEIAARRLHDELQLHTDAILVDTQARNRFDQLVLSVSPNASLYQARKAALRLRKSRRLQPELVARVTDWKRSIEEFSLDALRRDPEKIPLRPGVYVFRDQTGFLYIGQADNLRRRLVKHIGNSDRKALADYLLVQQATALVIELHIFQAGSPGEKLANRRAYESDMIRTRNPRLNIAP